MLCFEQSLLEFEYLVRCHAFSKLGVSINNLKCSIVDIEEVLQRSIFISNVFYEFILREFIKKQRFSLVFVQAAHNILIGYVLDNVCRLL